MEFLGAILVSMLSCDFFAPSLLESDMRFLSPVAWCVRHRHDKERHCKNVGVQHCSRCGRRYLFPPTSWSEIHLMLQHTTYHADSCLTHIDDGGAALLMYGMFCALCTSALWDNLTCQLGLPVSTTHTISEYTPECWNRLLDSRLFITLIWNMLQYLENLTRLKLFRDLHDQACHSNVL